MLEWIAYKCLNEIDTDLKSRVVKTVTNETVEPVLGSMVWCSLAFGSAEHSGIYVGEGLIVHLDGDGLIELVDRETFMARLNGNNFAYNTYVSCDEDGDAVGDIDAAMRALEMIGESRSYNVLIDNCHQFTSGCITGDFENNDNFFWMLKDTAKYYLGMEDFAVWG